MRRLSDVRAMSGLIAVDILLQLQLRWLSIKLWSLLWLRSYISRSLILPYNIFHYESLLGMFIIILSFYYRCSSSCNNGQFLPVIFLIFSRDCNIAASPCSPTSDQRQDASIIPKKQFDSIGSTCLPLLIMRNMGSPKEPDHHCLFST